jgi:hypothetical protein
VFRTDGTVGVVGAVGAAGWSDDEEPPHPARTAAAAMTYSALLVDGIESPGSSPTNDGVVGRRIWTSVAEF